MSSGDGKTGPSADEPEVPESIGSETDGDLEVPTGEEPTDPAAVADADPAAQRDEYLDALQRVKAEFANYRKRVERERDQMSDRAAARLAEDLLPVLDACDSGIAHGDEGAEAIRSQLIDVLGRSGLETVEAVGKPFDPQVHEAVLREEGDGSTETVVEIMRAGYTWRGRVLRPAMVKVGG